MLRPADVGGWAPGPPQRSEVNLLGVRVGDLAHVPPVNRRCEPQGIGQIETYLPRLRAEDNVLVSKVWELGEQWANYEHGGP